MKIFEKREEPFWSKSKEKRKQDWLSILKYCNISACVCVALVWLKKKVFFYSISRSDFNVCNNSCVHLLYAITIRSVHSFIEPKLMAPVFHNFFFCQTSLTSVLSMMMMTSQSIFVCVCVCAFGWLYTLYICIVNITMKINWIQSSDRNHIWKVVSILVEQHSDVIFFHWKLDLIFINLLYIWYGMKNLFHNHRVGWWWWWWWWWSISDICFSLNINQTGFLCFVD